MKSSTMSRSSLPLLKLAVKLPALWSCWHFSWNLMKVAETVPSNGWSRGHGWHLMKSTDVSKKFNSKVVVARRYSESGRFVRRLAHRITYIKGWNHIGMQNLQFLWATFSDSPVKKKCKIEYRICFENLIVFWFNPFAAFVATRGLI